MTRIYLLTSFGGEYEDEWEYVEAVFSSYAAMSTWIKGNFEQVETEYISNVSPEVPVIDEVYFRGSFKFLEHKEAVWLKYKAYGVIGEVDCKTDKIAFKENHSD